MSNVNFTLDEVSEVILLGLRASASALSRLIGKEAECTSVMSEYIPIAQIEQTGPTLPAVIAQMSCNGAASGKFALVIGQQDVQTILGILMSSQDSSEPFPQTELDEIAFVTVQELLNQMITAFCQTLTEFFGATVSLSALDLQLFDNLPAISTVFPYTRDDSAICSAFKMNISGVLSSMSMFCFSTEFAESVQRQLGSAAKPAQSGQSFQTAPVQQVTPPVQAAPTTPATRTVSAAPAPQPVRVQPIPTQQRQTERGSVSVQPTRFPAFSENELHGNNPLAGGNINLLMDVPLTVTIEIGKTRKKMRDIMDFAQGTVIGLEKQAGAPVDVVVNGQLIARGDVVVIDDNFAVRITEIVGTKDLLDNEQSSL